MTIITYRPVQKSQTGSDCPDVARLSRGDRLALALWWLIESVADKLEMPPERAADEVAMLCGLAKEMRGEIRSPTDFPNSA